VGIAAVAIAAVFGIWLLLTVVNQTPERWGAFPRVLRFDVFGLIPQWRFFAPIPGTSDYFLLYRVEVDDRWNPWVLVPSGVHRHRLAFLWNPTKRRGKVLIDITQDLARLASATSEAPRTICLSTPYIAVLTVIVNQAPQHPQATACQFAIASIDTVRKQNEAELIFRSEGHRLLPPSEHEPQRAIAAAGRG
jgi:hypothetical protein